MTDSDVASDVIHGGDLIYDPNISPSHLLHRAQQVAADLHVAAFGPSGLTQRQLAVLAALAQKEGVSQTDLVLKTGIDRSTLAEMVARMEAKGLTRRVKSEADSRANSVSLTEAGRAALAEALPKLEAIDANVLALLPASKRMSFVSLLTRLALPQAQTEKPSDVKVKKKKKKKEQKKKKAK